MKKIILPKEEWLTSDLYGVNKRKIDLKTEARWNLWTSVKTVRYIHNAVAGNYYFTGVGFKPKSVTFNSYVEGSGMGMAFGFGSTDWIVSDAYTVFESWSAICSVDREWDGKALYIQNASQSVRKIATFVSFDWDWVTLNFSFSAWSVIILATFIW